MPPTVVSTSPAGGALGVAVNTTIRVTFSEALLGGNVSVSLRAGSTPVASRVTYDAASLTATLTPGAALSADTQYTATVAADVSDLDGNRLAAPFVWTFTTAATSQTCGNGTCSGTETCSSCPSDCGSCPAGAVYYFSDCQTGAVAGCTPGSDANAGTSPSAPKRTLAGLDVNSLPAGSALMFKRGGAWNWSNLVLENDHVTTASPLVFDAYGSGAAPLIRNASNNAFHVGGQWGNTTDDGGYTFRNLKFDGLGTSVWGFWLVQNVHDVTFENVEITGFQIAINSSEGEAHGVNDIAILDSHIVRNSDMGFLGHVRSGLRIEGCTFEGNNYVGGSAFSHAVYNGGGSNGLIRNNHFIRNSVVEGSGRCTGGNVTFHGQHDGLLVEGNTILQDAADPGCWAISVTAGYSTPEWFRNVVIRGNTVINVGNTGIAANSAPGIRVEDNVVINTQATAQTAVNVGGSGYADGDVVDENAIVRNNTACYPTAPAGSSVVRVLGAGAQVTGNVMWTGAAATTGVCAR